MELPGIDYNAPVQDTSRSIEMVDEARRRSLGILQAGVAALGQEMVKTQHEAAAAKVETGMDADEEYLAKNRYIPVDQLKAELGPSYDTLDPEILGHRQIVRNEQGQDVEVVPTYLVAGPMFEARTRKNIEDASQGIMGEGWKSAFQAAAEKDLETRKRALAMTQAHAMTEDMAETTLGTVRLLAEAKRWPQALAALDRSNSLNPGQKEKARAEVVAAKAREDKVQEGLDAAAKVESQGQDILTKATTPGYPWVDETKANALVAAIPNNEPTKDKTRELVEHEVVKNKQIQRARANDQYQIALSLQNQGVGLFSADPRMAAARSYLLDPQNGGVEMWDSIVTRQQAQVRAARAELAQIRAAEHAATVAERQAAADARRDEASNTQLALDTFYGLPQDGVNGGDQMSVDLHQRFPAIVEGTDGWAKLVAAQNKVRETFAKGQGEGRKAFETDVLLHAQSLHYSKTDTAKFKTYMMNQYDQIPTTVAKPKPERAETDALFIDALGKVGGISGWFQHEKWREGVAPAPAPAPPAPAPAAPAPSVAPYRAGYGTPTGPLERKTVKGKTYEKRGDQWFEVTG